MFSLNKKELKKPESGKSATEQPEAAAAKAKKEEKDWLKDENIMVYVMPENFRVQKTGGDNSKMTGLFIIGGGLFFFLIASIGMYFYLFKTKPAPQPTAQVEQPAVVKKENTPTPIATPASETSKPAKETEPVISTTTPTTTPSQTPPVAAAPATFILGEDKDGDGLTDKEEAVLGADPASRDSDKDSYEDGQEVLSGYDPAQAAKKIAENKKLGSYDNKTYNYNFLYPIAWEVTKSGGDDSITVKSPDNQFFQVIVQPNPAKESILDWYKKQFNYQEVTAGMNISGNEWEGIKNKNGSIVYLVDKNKKYIITLNYGTGESAAADYLSIFGIALRSFAIK